ncbi:glycosyltransferase family 2 protein [Lachnospiraceae bacterium MD308]|nr:glycosyltransferase family 2 protein [Lachnospiraceae bacterium MD308]
MVQMFVKGRVSIVMPVYNGEQYLLPMLDSVLSQTYKEMEMILVDDGSTDGTVQAAESYQDRFAARGYKYRIVCAEHKCAAAAINEGLPFVTGEYLIWPDADDRLEKDSVEKRVEFLKKHSEYQCVRTLAYYYEENSEKYVRADENMEDYSNEELFWDILENRTYVCCGCYMLRTEPFFQIYPERRIPEYHVGQNFQMLLPFLYRHRCPTIPKKLYGVCVRQGSHSRMRLTQEEEEERYREYEDLIDEIADLCGIDDRTSRDRIAYWKLRRRYILAVKYRCICRIISSCRQMRQLHWHGQISIFRLLKDSVWICLENTWVIKYVYPVYRDSMDRFANTIRRLFCDLF